MNNTKKHPQKRETKRILLIGLGIMALIGAIQFNLARVYTLQQENSYGQDDLASLANSKVQRQTVLGQPQQNNKKAQQQEEDILLNDPAMSQKWDLSQTQAKEAWIKHRAVGSRSVKVCVIDTGIDINHPDLKNNLWRNPGEIGRDENGKDRAKNGIDDDNNGFIDDVHGFNFVGNNNDLTDRHGHGTHIAGAIGAEGGNNIGISGMAPQVSIITAKYYDPQSTANNNLINTVRAIRYCVAVGSDIINYSGGGLEPSEKEREAIALARDKGILFVAAAGNEQSNSDIRKYYPADYDLDNIISVTALDREKNVLPSSNYGITTVDIAAPGKNIYSTLPGGNYGLMTGTSQATAIVTGVAALIRAQFADFDASRIIRHITETGDLEPTKLNGKTKNQKRLNAYRALAILDQGTSVTGIIPKNAANLKASQFSVSTRDVTNESASSTIAPAELIGIGQEVRKILNDNETRRTR
jgi:subtilisin family serine protease